MQNAFKDKGKINIYVLASYFVLTGLFVFPRMIRLGIIGGFLANLNILPVIGYLIYSKKIKRSNHIYFGMILVILILALLTELNAGILSGKIVGILLFNLFIPLILIIPVNESHSADIVEGGMKVMNFFVTIICLCSIFDYFFGGITGQLIAQFSGDSTYIGLAQTERFLSYLGHPLYTNQVILTYYALNACYYHYIKRRNVPIRYFAIALITVIFVASKLGIVLLLLLYMSLNIKKLKYLALCIILVLMVNYLGLFDYLIIRFTYDTLTSNRIESLIILKEYNIKFFPLFIGYGTNYISYLTDNVYLKSSAAFEFVFLMFSSYFGVIFTILLYAIICVRPIYIFLKDKMIYMLICFLMVFVGVNSYNGLACFQDQMVMYCWFVFMLFNIMTSSHAAHEVSCGGENYGKIKISENL